MGQEISKKADEEIAQMVQSGNLELFGELTKRYEAKMKRYARKFLNIHEDIQDVVQEVFIKAYQNIKSFNAERKFSSWLYRIAHNEFVNALKKHKRRKVFSFFELDILLPYSFTKSDNQDIDHIDREKMRQMIDEYLDKLDLKYREPIILYYLEKLSYKEITDILHIPISTVGIRLKRGREKLKKLMGNKFYDQNHR